MVIYKLLPKEILVMVFQHFRFAKEIGECRLVCKAWNDPTETAMFSKPLVVYHEAKEEKVIRHLESNPAKGRCITSLTVTDYDNQHVMKRLLQLAFTPSIKRMRGKVLDIFSSAIRLSAIFTTMIEIAHQFDRFATIPDTFVLNDLDGKALLAFEEVKLRLFNRDDTQDVLHRFDEFKKLKALRMEEAEFSSIQELDVVLKGCHHLKELYLNVEIVDQTQTSDLPASSTAMWEQMQVEKEPSLEKLIFVSPGYSLAGPYGYGGTLYGQRSYQPKLRENLGKREASKESSVLFDIMYECPQSKELKLVNYYLVPDDRQNTFRIRMDRTSFEHFTYTTVPIEEMVHDREGQDAIDHFTLVMCEMHNSWTSLNIYFWLGIKEAGKKIYFMIPIAHSNQEDLTVCQEMFDLRPVKESPLIRFTCFNIKSLCFQLGSVSFTIKEDFIRKFAESSVMSYLLEKGDIDDDEEEE